MKISRSILLAAFLFVAPCSFIMSSEGGPVLPPATDRSILVAVPLALIDAAQRLTDNVLAVPFNVVTSRLFKDTRFQDSVTNINRLAILTTLAAAYYYYNAKYNAQEEENNDDPFGDDFDNTIE